jgi:hypothetical protein
MEESGKMASDEGLCEVHVPESPFETDIILKALEQEGIPATCRRHEEIAYDGIFVPQRGWGAILVPGVEKERALAVINEILRTYPPKPDGPC